jgi:pimeloyl-ACP methyl ester carboxylesterase
MPYVNSQGVGIHYEVEGDGPPLMLQHGAVSSLEAWRRCGYVQVLKHHYQCILLDARGRGDSDKPHDPAAYALQCYVADVVAILDALHIRTAHYWGYSMGGWIGFGMAKYAPERAQTLVIGGAHPYEDRSHAAFQHVDGTDPDAFIAALEVVTEERVPPESRSVVLANDLQALAAATQVRPSLEEVLPTMAMPCMLYVGEADSRFAAVKACATHMPNVTFVSLPGLNHAQGMVQSKVVLPHVTKFLASVHQEPVSG